MSIRLINPVASDSCPYAGVIIKIEIIEIMINDFKTYLPHLYHLIASDISFLVANPSSNNKFKLY